LNHGIGVSVVIPARDAERYLSEAIESVLGQTHRPLETILVDDGSTDATAAIASSFGSSVRVLSRGPGPGNVGAARTLGADSARGSALAFLDADDRWEPPWLALATAALGAMPPPALIFGGLREFVSPELKPEEAARLRVNPKVRAAYHASGTLVTRRAYERIGPFNSTHPGAEFTDWVMRARDLRVNEQVVDQLTVNRRIHGRNTTLLRRHQLQDHAFAIKASLDRRRARGRL
jgi:glycosyltransferase involved in cell wall biosynthesis